VSYTKEKYLQAYCSAFIICNAVKNYNCHENFPLLQLATVVATNWICH